MTANQSARAWSTKASSSVDCTCRLPLVLPNAFEPTRHIDWAGLADEQALSDQIWAALPTDPKQRDRSGVRKFLEHEGLRVAEIDDGRVVYAYADGPSEPGSPVGVRVVSNSASTARVITWADGVRQISRGDAPSWAVESSDTITSLR
jgi:hypothetical protein